MSVPKIEKNDNSYRYSIFCPTGYHGDPYLMAVVDDLAKECQQFVETGTEAGSTVGYTARMYPHLGCYTAEADKGTCELAAGNLVNHDNIVIKHQLSQEFMREIPVPGYGGVPNGGSSLFWLDAHSHGFGCPLGEEVSIALERWNGGYILIDDFQVPGKTEFGFDWYVGDQGEYKLTWDTILKDLPSHLRAKINSIHYPNYTPPKIAARGWVLIQFGDAPMYVVPDYVSTVKEVL